MCDPITLGLLGASTAASVAGGAMTNAATQKNNRNAAIAASQQNAENFQYNLADQERWGDYQKQVNLANLKQIAQDSAAANAENVQRDKAIGSYDVNQGTNDKTISDLISRFSGPSQAAAYDKAAIGRTSAINANMLPAQPITAAETGANASPAVAEAFRNAAATGDAASRARAAALGNLGAYTDTWTGNDAAVTRAGSDIANTNAAATLTSQMLPGQQQLAGFTQQPPIATPFPTQAPAPPAPVYQAPPVTSGAGAALTGLGQLGGAIAGSGKAPAIANSLGNLFNTTTGYLSGLVPTTPAAVGTAAYGRAAGPI
jgi:hypothetical protein